MIEPQLEESVRVAYPSQTVLGGAKCSGAATVLGRCCFLVGLAVVWASFLVLPLDVVTGRDGGASKMQTYN